MKKQFQDLTCDYEDIKRMKEKTEQELREEKRNFDDVSAQMQVGPNAILISRE